MKHVNKMGFVKPNMNTSFGAKDENKADEVFNKNPEQILAKKRRKRIHGFNDNSTKVKRCGRPKGKKDSKKRKSYSRGLGQSQSMVEEHGDGENENLISGSDMKESGFAEQDQNHVGEPSNGSSRKKLQVKRRKMVVTTNDGTSADELVAAGVDGETDPLVVGNELQLVAAVQDDESGSSENFIDDDYCVVEDQNHIGKAGKRKRQRRCTSTKGIRMRKPRVIVAGEILLL